MSIAATVLIPTHDHGRTLLRSVPSALAQTVSELEVFVVGDGVPDETRELMAELAAGRRARPLLRQPEGRAPRRGPPACGAAGGPRRDRLLPLGRRRLAAGPRRGAAAAAGGRRPRAHPLRSRSTPTTGCTWCGSTSRASTSAQVLLGGRQPDPPLDHRPHARALPAAARGLAADTARGSTPTSISGSGCSRCREREPRAGLGRRCSTSPADLRSRLEHRAAARARSTAGTTRTCPIARATAVARQRAARPCRRSDEALTSRERELGRCWPHARGRSRRAAPTKRLGCNCRRSPTPSPGGCAAGCGACPGLRCGCEGSSSASSACNG